MSKFVKRVLEGFEEDENTMSLSLLLPGWDGDNDGTDVDCLVIHKRDEDPAAVLDDSNQYINLNPGWELKLMKFLIKRLDKKSKV